MRMRTFSRTWTTPAKESLSRASRHAIRLLERLLGVEKEAGASAIDRLERRGWRAIPIRVKSARDF